MYIVYIITLNNMSLHQFTNELLQFLHIFLWCYLLQGSVPWVASCSLANQVNICTNGSATVSGGGGCSESPQCVMALNESTTVDECCNKIVESLTTNAPPTSGQSGDICGVAEAQTMFGDALDHVNTASLQGREIHEGTFIVHHMDPDFICKCNGCIKYIWLAVSPNSELKTHKDRRELSFTPLLLRWEIVTSFKEKRMP